jgi:hypothetical protein
VRPAVIAKAYAWQSQIEVENLSRRISGVTAADVARDSLAPGAEYAKELLASAFERPIASDIALDVLEEVLVTAAARQLLEPSIKRLLAHASKRAEAFRASASPNGPTLRQFAGQEARALVAGIDFGAYWLAHNKRWGDAYRSGAAAIEAINRSLIREVSLPTPIDDQSDKAFDLLAERFGPRVGRKLLDELRQANSSPQIEADRAFVEGYLLMEAGSHLLPDRMRGSRGPAPSSGQDSQFIARLRSEARSDMVRETVKTPTERWLATFGDRINKGKAGSAKRETVQPKLRFGR